jgi:fucose permease
MKNMIRLMLYGATSLVLGFAVILLPSAGYLFRDPRLYGITDGQYGMLFLPMVMATIGTGFGFEALVSAFGRRRVYLAGFVITVAALALMLAASFVGTRPAEVFWLLMAAQTLLGFGFALLMSSVSVFSIELLPSHRTTALTAIHASFGIGALLSPLALDAWSRAHFWQGVVAMGLVGTAGVGVAAALSRSELETSVPTGPARSINPLKIFSDLPGRAKGFVLALVLYGTVEAGVSNWSTIYLTQERGYSATTAAVCLSVFWGFLAGGRVAATFLSMRVSSQLLFRTAPFVAMAGLILLRSTRAEADIFFPYAVIGLGCSYTFPVSVSLTTRYHEADRLILPSFMLAGLMTGVGIGSTAIGFLRGVNVFTLDQAFTGAIAAAAGLCVIFYVLTRPGRHRVLADSDF